MKYLCLVCFDGKAMDKHTPEAWKQLQRDSTDYDKALIEAGHLLEARALHGVETATTVRMRNGKVSTTDGPFAETKEQVAGFILIEAADLNEALRIAGNIPMARVGSVEVRPVYDYQADL